jgi:hypothetical protein
MPFTKKKQKQKQNKTKTKQTSTETRQQKNNKKINGSLYITSNQQCFFPKNDLLYGIIFQFFFIYYEINYFLKRLHNLIINVYFYN